VITSLFKKGLSAYLFRKALIENEITFGFEKLIPKPYRRDQPGQRLRVNGCRSTVLEVCSRVCTLERYLVRYYMVFYVIFIVFYQLYVFGGLLESVYPQVVFDRYLEPGCVFLILFLRLPIFILRQLH
jgi:hypothetical protein